MNPTVYQDSNENVSTYESDSNPKPKQEKEDWHQEGHPAINIKIIKKFRNYGSER